MKKVVPNLFGNGGWTNFYKNDEPIAIKENGEFIKLLQHKGPSYDTCGKRVLHRPTW